MLQLHNISSSRGARKKRKIRGRGDSSGHGSYSGRGRKGQRARAGGKGGLKYLGIRRMMLSTPKRGGFRSLYLKPAVVNIKDIERLYQDGEKVTQGTLREKGILKKIASMVKILSQGELTKKIVVEGCLLSKSAKEKIIKAGGSVL
jgi:large subunit ribosomal protein L15